MSIIKLTAPNTIQTAKKFTTARIIKDRPTIEATIIFPSLVIGSCSNATNDKITANPKNRPRSFQLPSGVETAPWKTPNVIKSAPNTTRKRWKSPSKIETVSSNT